MASSVEVKRGDEGKKGEIEKERKVTGKKQERKTEIERERRRRELQRSLLSRGMMPRAEGDMCVGVCRFSRMHARTSLILWRNYSERKIIQSRGTQVTVAGIRASILEYIGRICGFETLIEERIGFYFRLSISARTSIIT